MARQALLGKVINLDKDDLIQSVGQGGSDSSVDWRGISNYIKTKRVPYTWTQADHDNGYATVPLAWDTAFADANYTCTMGVQDLSGVVATEGAWVGDMHNFLASGFNAIVYEYSIGNPIPVGSMFVVHAIGIHD